VQLDIQLQSVLVEQELHRVKQTQQAMETTQYFPQ
jgi:hypothetical protein